MRYLVTGAAGFIGSQLLRTLLERGHDATGWDAYTDYYDPALKEENARGLPVDAPGPRGGRSRPRRLRRRLPPGGSAWRRELRRHLPRLRAPERPREPAPVRAGGRCRDARGLRLLVVDLRRRRVVPDARGHDPAAAVAVRDHEARLRAPRARVRDRIRARRRRRALLHDLRAAPAARHGVHERW